MPHWYRRILLLAIPLILSNLTQPLLSTVDTILSGHLPSASALGGVAVGGIFFNAIFWTFAFLRMATTGLVAQAYGAHNEDQLLHHFARAFLAAMVIGVMIPLFHTPLISIALNLLGASQEVRQNAQVYCNIRIWSAPASLANFTILGYLLCKQRAPAALLLQAAINVVNVVAALFLVLRLHWGVAGIATATLAAEWTGCLLGLVLLSSSVHPSRLRSSELLDPVSLRRLFALNRDIFLRTLSMVAAYAWFTRAGAKAGDTVLAANAVLMNFHWIAAYGLDGFANATETLVGESIGANRRQNYLAVIKASTTLAFAVSALISMAYLFFGRQIINVFTNQESVRQLAMQYLPWVVCLPIASVWSFQLDGIFVGATRATDLRNSMFISFVVFLGLAILLSRTLGNHGLWCAMLCFMLLRGITLGLRLPKIERTAFAEKVVEA